MLIIFATREGLDKPVHYGSLACLPIQNIEEDKKSDQKIDTLPFWPRQEFTESKKYHIPIFLPVKYVTALYNTVVGVQANFCVSYPDHVILGVKCIV